MNHWINLNGKNCKPSSFDWLHDSGFRYGYGCFETMLMNNENVPLFNYHFKRISESLHSLGILDFNKQETILQHIQSLYDAQHHEEESKVCRLFISGGQVSISPKFQSKPTEIISIDSMIETPLPKQFEFKTVTPHDFYTLKSLNYAHNIVHLNTASHWPIYIDNQENVIDSAIFAVGIIKNNELIFAKHNTQLPSVSRQFYMDNAQNITILNQTLTRDDIEKSDAVIGCNAIKGIFELTNTNHLLVTKLQKIWKTI
ncbi:MAG: aminotransferase class IV [Candidatus Margulisiibacteriota bacterium]